ncbi:Pentatricopeptide repeat-containing protein [Rhynchospora pubera]|uniref:Pentatricopeptide repeat-containing protein n=1 Tax=Rhynchospora pubera TaxID=906938 RepID=A0AAV8GX50_9POAL|nr:Pentatricopeptide repeat-containing protein [Rhynchospora pubera]
MYSSSTLLVTVLFLPRPRSCSQRNAGKEKETAAMRYVNLTKSFIANLSASRRSIARASSHSSTSLSTELVSSLNRAKSKHKPQPPLSPHSPGSSAAEVSREISDLLLDGEIAEESTSNSSPEFADRNLVNNLLGIDWNPNPSTTQNARKKEMTRERKKRSYFKNTESRRYTKLMKVSVKRLGTASTLEFFSKLGRESGTKEYNALIRLCIDGARSKDKEEAFDYISDAYKLLDLMKEKGFVIEEASYGPILLYLVDFKMVHEFDEICELLKEENRRAWFRLAYYEMLLCIRVSDEERIKKLLGAISMASDDDKYNLAENYFLAFCESDREEQLIKSLEVLNINNISKPCYVDTIFKSLGRLQLENDAHKLLYDISKAGSGSERFSALVYEYTTNLPNLQAKDMVLKFASLHEKFEAVPSLLYYNKLISYFCNLNLIAEALVVVDYMCKSGLNVSIEVFDPILYACDQTCELHMVRSIYSVMHEHNLRLKGETFKTLISYFVKMKDFQGACNLLEEAKLTGEIPTAGMYNAIIHGYLKEKNRSGVQMILKGMKMSGVEPDADTFSYLISNSDSEKDILKYREELRQAGLQITRSVCIGLIQAYSKLGIFHMAKQVVEDPDVPLRYIVEIKSALMSNLAVHGEISAAIKIYEEMKQDGFNPESKAVVSLIEHIKAEGEMERITGLLKELKDSVHWCDACSRVILYCVQHDCFNDAVGFLKELREKDKPSAYMCIDQIFCHMRNTEPIKLETGMRLLHVLKEELGFHVSRTSLDFLLSMCAKAGDSRMAMIVWKEYESAGLPYNVLTKLRMYQALIASGEFEDAKKMLKDIPQQDEHVRYIIKSYKQAYLCQVRSTRVC